MLILPTHSGSSFSICVTIERSVDISPSIGNKLLASFHRGVILLAGLEMTRKSTFHDPRDPYSSEEESRYLSTLTFPFSRFIRHRDDTYRGNIYVPDLP